jgi:hypothetical protein
MTTIAVPQVSRPSMARAVTLDGLLPLPRGALPADLPPLAWPAKDPGDVLDYAIDATAAVAGDPTDRIATVSVAITPQSAPGDLALGAVVAEGATAVLWLSAGQVGTTYAVSVQLSTLNGRVIGRTVLLAVQQLAGAAAPTTTLSTPAGAVVTDQNGNPILIGS